MFRKRFKVVFATFEGEFTVLATVWDRIVAVCEALKALEKIEFHLWIGPNMCKPHNMVPLLKLIKQSKLVEKKIVLKKIAEDEFLTSIIGKSFYEKVRFLILGPYCNYGAYTDVIRYAITLYYLLKYNLASIIYLDATDTYVPGTQDFYKHEPVFAEKLKQKFFPTLFEYKPKSGILAAEIYNNPDTPDIKRDVVNAFFLVTKKQFSEFLWKETRKNFNPFLLDVKTRTQQLDMDPIRLLVDDLVNTLCGCELKHTKMIDQWDSRNETGHTITNSGPNFFDNTINKYLSKNPQHKKADCILPRGSDSEHREYWIDWNEVVKSGNTWTIMTGTRSSYSITHHILPQKKYKTFQALVYDFLDSITILLKYTHIFALSYYLVLMLMYQENFRINLDYFIQRLVYKLPRNMTNIRVLNLVWAEHAKAKIEITIKKQYPESTKRTQPRCKNLEKKLADLKQIIPIAENLNAFVKDGMYSSAKLREQLFRYTRRNREIIV